MSIDKESNGVPEFNMHRRTTKVNLSVIFGVVAFFVIGGLVMAWWLRNHGN